MDDFPLLPFLAAFILVFAFCLGVSLMIMRGLSGDNETSILKQLWYTFFGGTGDKQ